MNSGGNGSGSYGMMQLPMDCDTGQGQEGGGLGYVGNGTANSKQYSLLQNVGASYGLITIKDDEDEGILNSANSYSQYEDSMFVDIATGAVVDPLQFTATLTFSSPADQNALLESISDELLQRIPPGIPESADLLPEAIENLTSSIPGPIEPAVDPFPEHNALGLAQRSNYNDTSRNFAAPTHFTKNAMFLNSSNNNSDTSGASSFHNLPKERPELALHISSSGTSQEQPMQQLQVCILLSRSCPQIYQAGHQDAYTVQIFPIR
jgi:ovo-like protein